MKPFSSLCRWILVTSLAAQCLFASAVEAEELAVARAREYFQAGAQAYSIGEYGAAIQAFQQAYALAPRPAVLFSIAQAERRQYFLDRNQQHLTRAIEMYRRYLAEEGQTARKPDAVEALSELEPLLNQAKSAEASGARPVAGAAISPTRLMVSSPAQGAKISLDRQPLVPPPVVRELEPGEHVIHVEAPGYRSVDRRVIAVSGELVTVDIPLLELPALLDVQAPVDAQLSIDGRVQGRCPFPKPLELAAGVHVITVSKSGFIGVSRERTLVRGQTTVFVAPLRRSNQRTTALFLLGASASALTAGGIFAFIAYNQRSAAETFLDSRGRQPLSPSDLAQYNSQREDYNRIRSVAWLSVGVGVGFGITSLLLRTYDSGSVETIKGQENPSQKARRQPPSLIAEPLVGPTFNGIGLRGVF
ncbi:MAG TPA: PEGA domain-containing protein [Polyangiaceae bacterium]|nr:PEGA domain-containing protein [Polyangiaceae bacterium]